MLNGPLSSLTVDIPFSLLLTASTWPSGFDSLFCEDLFDNVLYLRFSGFTRR